MRLLVVLVLAPLIVMSAVKTSAADRYVFVGDSLVDNHNSFDLSTPVFGVTIPQSPPYFQGRFSNGLNWTDRLSSNQAFYSGYFLNAPGCDASGYANTSACGSIADPGVLPDTSLNFAVGGSRSGTEVIGVTGGPGMLTVLNDLTAYVNQGRVAGTSNAVFAIWTGGNDYTGYLNAPAGTAAQQVSTTLGQIGQGIEKIDVLGAKRVIVLNLFDLGRVPTVAAAFSVASASELSTLHNQGLPGLLATQRSSTGLDIVLVDVDALYSDIFARPSFYGFTNTTGACINSTTLAATGQCPTTASENATLFWDGQHPTTAAHALIAQLVSATLYAVDSGAANLRPVGETQLVANRTLLASMRSQLGQWHMNGLSQPGGRVSVADASGENYAAALTPTSRARAFVSGERRNGNAPAASGVSAYDFNANSLLMGIETPVTDSTMAGVHIGVVSSGSSISSGGSSASQAYVMGVHGGWRADALTITAQASFAWVDVNKIERPTGFSPMPMAKGDTTGWLAAGEAEARYAIPLSGDIMAAPLARFGGSFTRLRGYQETDAGFMDLTVDRTSVSEVSAGLGAAIWTDLQRSWGALHPEATLVFDYQLLRRVDAVDASLSSGQQLTALPDRRRSDSVTLGARLGFAFDNGMSLDLSVATTYGDDGSRMNVLPFIQFSKDL